MEINNLAFSTINLSSFSSPPQLPILPQHNPQNINMFHPFIGQRVLEQHCLPMPTPLFNPFYPSSPFIPPITPHSVFTTQQNLVKLQQLQIAFHLGVERKQSWNSRPKSISPHANVEVKEIVKTQESKETLKQTCEVRQDMISHWDPWFHRRAKRQAKKEIKIENTGAMKTKLEKIRKRRTKNKTTKTKKCASMSTNMDEGRHLNHDSLKTSVLFKQYETQDIMESKFDLLPGSNENRKLSFDRNYVNRYGPEKIHGMHCKRNDSLNLNED